MHKSVKRCLFSLDGLFAKHMLENINIFMSSVSSNISDDMADHKESGLWQSITHSLEYASAGLGWIRGKNPLVLSYYVTGPCNAKCQMCHTPWKKHYPDKELSLDETGKMIGDGYEAGLRVLYILGGEPLLRQKTKGDVIKMMEKAKNVGYKTVLNTNGFWLPDYADSLAEVADRIVVSIDSPFAEIHNAQRGVKRLYENALAGAHKFREIIEIKNPKSGVNINSVMNRTSLRSPYNRDENAANGDKTVEGLERLSKELGATLTFSAMCPDSEARGDGIFLLPGENQRLFSRIYEVKHAQNNGKVGKILNSDDYLLWQSGKKSLSYHCPLASSSVVVDEFGNVAEACNHYEPVKFGNVKETPLSQMVSSEKYRKLMSDTWNQECNSVDPAIVDTSLLLDALRHPQNVGRLVRMGREYLSTL